MGSWGSPFFLLGEIVNFLCKWAPGDPQAHLLKEDAICMWAQGGSFTYRKLWFLMQMSSWDRQEVIYFKKLLISFASELLGIPRPTYLKKFVISYANELQSVPKQKSRISYANEVLGIPRLTYLKRSVTSYADEYPQAHLLEEISGFLGKWAPGSSFT